MPNDTFFFHSCVAHSLIRLLHGLSFSVSEFLSLSFFLVFWPAHNLVSKYSFDFILRVTRIHENSTEKDYRIMLSIEKMSRISFCLQNYKIFVFEINFELEFPVFSVNLILSSRKHMNKSIWILCVVNSTSMAVSKMDQLKRFHSVRVHAWWGKNYHPFGSKTFSDLYQVH